MKVLIWIIYLAAWLVHGLVLDLCGLGKTTWEYWVLTVAMSISCIFLPSHWR